MDQVNELDLGGKVSVITGGTSGIGLEIVKTFNRNNSNIVFVGRNEKKGKEISESLDVPSGTRCIFMKCDVGEHKEVKETCEKIIGKFGKIDILVLNAGTEFSELVNEIKIENWKRVIDVNLGGPFYFIRYCAGSMMAQKKGNIIIVSSVVSLTGAGGGMHYTASKAGLNGIASRVNYELLPSGIRANIINPGVIDTPMLRKKYPDTEENNKMLAAQIPVGRIGVPADIANLALFFASDLSGYICGQEIFVDGGRTIFRRPPGSIIGPKK